MVVLRGPVDQLSASIVKRLGKLAGELGTAQYRGSSQVAQLCERIMTTARPMALPSINPSEPT
ncbi:hypothetical protein [Streptomyces sp. G45]|uniref:hypothetical protein n=1 Tax=Streptomyces sp. G45 TaxID=3406627 RepID=UPI003C140791